MRNNYISPLKSDPLTNEFSRNSEMIMNSNKEKRSPEKIYQALVNRLKIIARDELSDQEAHSAARNLIGFYQVIMDYKIKKQNEMRNEQKIYKI